VRDQQRNQVGLMRGGKTTVMGGKEVLKEKMGVLKEDWWRGKKKRRKGTQWESRVGQLELTTCQRRNSWSSCEGGIRNRARGCGGEGGVQGKATGGFKEKRSRSD